MVEAQKQGYSAERAIEIFKEIIENPQSLLDKKQRELATECFYRLVERINRFEAWRVGKSKSDILDLFDLKRENVTDDVCEVTFPYPGVVAILIKDQQSYEKVAKLGSKGEFSVKTGTGQIKGHVLLLNSSANEATIRHEYQHFLYQFTAFYIKRGFEQKKTELSPAESQEIRDLEKRVTQLQQQINLLRHYPKKSRFLKNQKRIVSAEILLKKSEIIKRNTLIHTCFLEFQNECVAYAIAQRQIPLRMNSFIKEHEFLEGSREYEDFLRQDAQLEKLLVKAGKVILKQRLAYIIASASSIEQMLQFIYLELQVAHTERKKEITTPRDETVEEATSIPEAA